MEEKLVNGSNSPRTRRTIYTKGPGEIIPRYNQQHSTPCRRKAEPEATYVNVDILKSGTSNDESDHYVNIEIQKRHVGERGLKNRFEKYDDTLDDTTVARATAPIYQSVSGTCNNNYVNGFFQDQGRMQYVNLEKETLKKEALKSGSYYADIRKCNSAPDVNYANLDLYETRPHSPGTLWASTTSSNYTRIDVDASRAICSSLSDHVQQRSKSHGAKDLKAKLKVKSKNKKKKK